MLEWERESEWERERGKNKIKYVSAAAATTTRVIVSNKQRNPSLITPRSKRPTPSFRRSSDVLWPRPLHMASISLPSNGFIVPIRTLYTLCTLLHCIFIYKRHYTHVRVMEKKKVIVF